MERGCASPASSPRKDIESKVRRPEFPFKAFEQITVPLLKEGESLEGP